METGPRLKVSSDRLVKPEIKHATPDLRGKRFIHYTTAAPNDIIIYHHKEQMYNLVEMMSSYSIANNKLV